MAGYPLHRSTRRSANALILEHAPFFLYACATIVISIGMFRGQTSISRYLSLKDSELVLTKAVSEIEKENNRLEDEIKKLRSSKDYARKVLRDKYHVTDADEKIIYFAD